MILTVAPTDTTHPEGTGDFLLQRCQNGAASCGLSTASMLRRDSEDRAVGSTTTNDISGARERRSAGDWNVIVEDVYHNISKVLDMQKLAWVKAQSSLEGNTKVIGLFVCCLS